MLKDIVYLFQNYEKIEKYQQSLKTKQQKIEKTIKFTTLQVTKGQLPLKKAITQYNYLKYEREKNELMQKRLKSIMNQTSEFYKRLSRKERHLVNYTMTEPNITAVIKAMNKHHSPYYLLDYNRDVRAIITRWRTQTDITEKNIRGLQKEIRKLKNYEIT